MEILKFMEQVSDQAGTWPIFLTPWPSSSSLPQTFFSIRELHAGNQEANLFHGGFQKRRVTSWAMPASQFPLMENKNTGPAWQVYGVCTE